MDQLQDFHRDFLPEFIDPQRSFHDGDAAPNLAVCSTADPVTLFAARGRVDAGTERVTKRSGSLPRHSPTCAGSSGRPWPPEWTGTSRIRLPSSDIPLPSTAALSLSQSSTPRTCIAARTNFGARCTATPTAGRLTEPQAKRWPTVADRGVIR